MMKKLFALLVVLALCGLANAATISLVDQNNQITVAAGGSVTLCIEVAGGLLGLDALFTVTGDATITAAMSPDIVVYPAGYPFGWDSIMEPIITSTTAEIGGTSLSVNNGQTIGYIEITYGSGEVVVSVQNGTSIGGSIDETYGTPTFSQGVVTLVPEPMTVALLGLGGLFIRRRK